MGAVSNSILSSPLKINRPIDVIEAIKNRQAVRHYTSEPVSEKDIQLLLECAVEAPSAVNRQPWAFVIIQNPELLEEISASAKKMFLKQADLAHGEEHGFAQFKDPAFDIFYGAKSLVVICAVVDGVGFSTESDCFLAGENLMLGACGLGLGTCPIGFARDVLRESAMKKRLQIPGNYIPVLPIVVGYASQIQPQAPRKPAKILSWSR